MAHGRDPKVGARVAHAGWVATRGLDPARQLLYSDLIFASISEATRQRLQELLMASGNYVYQSDFAKTHQAAGRAEGKAEGKAESVLRVLAARRLSVSDEQRDRIAACADVAQLDTWLERAVTVASADAVFDD